MRIISGIYKGRKLSSSSDLSIRPTTDRVKEYIFNILQDFPVGRVVADLFSGSGNLGIEALSRGADRVIFVEKSSSSINILNKNLRHLQVPTEKYSIIQSDAVEFARNATQKIDLCLLDPPFEYPPLQELIDTIFESELRSHGFLLVVEHEISNPLKVESALYQVLKQKKFGRSEISFLESKEQND